MWVWWLANEPQKYQALAQLATEQHYIIELCGEGAMSCGALLPMRKIQWEAGGDLRPLAFNSTFINYHKTRHSLRSPRCRVSLKLQLVYQILYFQTVLSSRNPNIGALNPPLISCPRGPPSHTL